MSRLYRSVSQYYTQLVQYYSSDHCSYTTVLLTLTLSSSVVDYNGTWYTFRLLFLLFSQKKSEMEWEMELLTLKLKKFL